MELWVKEPNCFIIVNKIKIQTLYLNKKRTTKPKIEQPIKIVILNEY